MAPSQTPNWTDETPSQTPNWTGLGSFVWTADTTHFTVDSSSHTADGNHNDFSTMSISQSPGWVSA